MTHEELVEWLRRSREKQGLPLHADDLIGLGRVADLILTRRKNDPDTADVEAAKTISDRPADVSTE